MSLINKDFSCFEKSHEFSYLYISFKDCKHKSLYYLNFHYIGENMQVGNSIINWGGDVHLGSSNWP